MSTYKKNQLKNTVMGFISLVFFVVVCVLIVHGPRGLQGSEQKPDIIKDEYMIDGDTVVYYRFGRGGHVTCVKSNGNLSCA